MKQSVILLFLTLMVRASDVFGCSCVHSSDEELVDAADHIFVAQISSAKFDPSSSVEERIQVFAQFEVMAVLKGDPSLIGQLVGGLGMGDCSVPFTVGHHLLVYTDDSGELSICSGTRAVFPWEEEAIEFFQDIKAYIESAIPIEPYDGDEW